MREMKDSGVEWIGEIPKEWDCCKQKYKITLINGRAYKDNEFEEEGKYRILRVGNLFSNPVWYSSSLELEEDKYCDNGDLIYAWSMSYGPYIWSGEKVIYHYHIWKAKITDDMDKMFAYYYYQALTESIKSETHETTMGFVTMGNMNNSYIAYPKSNVEQKRIADYLDTKCAKIDSIIEKQQAIIEKLKEYKLSVITEAVTKGINHNVQFKESGYYWLGEVPEHWEEDTVYRAISFEGGSQPPLQQFIDEPRDGYIRLIQNRDYKTDDYATYVPIDSVTKFCEIDDVMIGRYGPPVFVIHRGLKGAYNVALMKAIPIKLDREFMFYYLQNTTLLSYITSFSIRTAGQTGVNPAILKKYAMFIPPMEEQIVIADYLKVKVSLIDNEIEKRNRAVEKLIQFKKSLIYEVVTGKKEV